MMMSIFISIFIGAELQCIYFSVLYTDLKAHKGISAFQTMLLF